MSKLIVALVIILLALIPDPIPVVDELLLALAGWFVTSRMPKKQEGNQ